MAYKHDNEDLPMTPEKAIKLKGMEYINRFRNVGISLDKSKLAAVVLAVELKENFISKYPGTPAEKQKKIDQFDLLIKGIEAY
jgi:hypothetical protein